MRHGGLVIDDGKERPRLNQSETKRWLFRPIKVNNKLSTCHSLGRSPATFLNIVIVQVG